MSLEDLIDLAAEELGGAVLLANDEFFAPKENLLKPHAAEWREHEYTERGKWMDGWETRRRREPGGGAGFAGGGQSPQGGAPHDWCIVRLGLPGAIRGVIVDTAFFRGNCPAECSIEACAIDATLDLDALPKAEWVEILGRSPLKGDTKNAFEIENDRRFTHVRLNIFPDGGVARLRVHGDALPDLRKLARFGGLVDLAAVENGGRSILCSDMFFGSRNNLLLPGRPRDMSSGWETRRRRGPGNDWNVVQLGVPGTVRRLEIDTTHFKGNAPGRCMVDACNQPQSLDSAEWRVLLPETTTQPHTRHFFEDELRSVGRMTHLRLNVYPDGGVARLRAWGEADIADPRDQAVTRLNIMSRVDAVATLRTFCGSLRWAEDMADEVPFENAAALYRIADRLFWELSEAGRLEAFAVHPPIGATEGSPWSKQEQSGVQDAQRAELARLNQEYFDKFGFVFLVCATGRSGEEMLAELRRRLGATRAEEIRTATEEQSRILRLRIGKWLEST
ncbi:MAG: allantoicase [Myxococcales bacterium]|nr:allantoicase [Myxococcales bacterium]